MMHHNMTSLRTISPGTARRLAITKQHLAHERYEPTAKGIYQVVNDIGCLQLDPLSTVARSHTLVVFSRVGPYKISDLDDLIYRDRKLFEYWAHAASIVLTQEYPVHHLRMREYAKGDDPWYQRVRAWIEQNKPLHDRILREIKRNGPISLRALTEGGEAPKAWVSSGWTGDRNVSRMLDFLWMQGKVMVARREGLNKYWDLSERVLPEWTPRDKWSEQQVVNHAAQKSLKALGVATERHIAAHYTAGRYPELRKHLNRLEQTRVIERVHVGDKQGVWKGDYYIHSADLPLVEKLERGEFDGRTVLLSPFDNLVRDRVRNLQFWDFDYKIEIYTPQAKRKYGYYVLPILHNDRLIGRIDPKMDRASRVLNVNAVYAEPNAPQNLKTGRAVRDAIEELGEFLDATKINFTSRVPDGWRRALK